MNKLYCPECGEYLMGGDGECHDCRHCGWMQYKPREEKREQDQDEEESQQ